MLGDLGPRLHHLRPRVGDAVLGARAADPWQADRAVVRPGDAGRAGVGSVVRWTYLVVKFEPTYDVNKITAALDKFGEKGWELIKIDRGNTQFEVWYFKRPADSR